MKSIKFKIIICICVLAVLTNTRCNAKKTTSGKINNSNITWQYDKKQSLLIISGKGKIPSNYEYSANDGEYLSWNTCCQAKYIVIGEGITEIGKGAFFEFSNLKTIQFPSTLKRIRDGAFCSSDQLEKIELPSHLREIGNDVFCSRYIKKVELPKSLRKIGKSAFSGTKIKQVKLPPNLKTIGKGAFSETNISCLKIPNSVTKINYDKMFYGCKHVHKVTRVSKKQKQIGREMYKNCLGLKSVKIPSGIQKINHSAFLNCKKMTKVQFCKSVKEIGDFSFENCSSLKAVSLPDDLQKIGTGTFQNTGIRVLVIPANVTTIGSKKRSEAERVERIEQGEVCQKLGIVAGCKNLKVIEIQTLNLETIYPLAFEYTPSNVIIKVPEQKLDAYSRMLREAGLPESVSIVAE